MKPSRTVEILALETIGEVHPYDDISALLIEALDAQGVVPHDQDILVVTSKIVSKAQNRFVCLADMMPGEDALRLAAVTGKNALLVELVLRESSAVVRAAPQVLITRHRLGFVMANAGIDQSNLGPGREGEVLLLPTNPDGVAVQLRQSFARHFGAAPAIVLSDSFGRPWRNGVVNIAIGASGLPSLLDRRGEADRDGRILAVTQIAVGDMVASAAGLVCGEDAEGIPAALVRGYTWPRNLDRPASALLRPAEQDLFR